MVTAHTALVAIDAAAAVYAMADADPSLLPAAREGQTLADAVVCAYAVEVGIVPQGTTRLASHEHEHAVCHADDAVALALLPTNLTPPF